jgi:group I intron endonuclease
MIEFNFEFRLFNGEQTNISRQNQNPLRSRAFSTKLPCPEKVYLNADTQRLQIIEENKEKSGIYMWKNSHNGNIYIGSAKNIKRRLTSYYNINYLVKESSMYINRAILKEGYSAFSLTILEYCDEKKLIQREQYYIDLLNPDYNLCRTAGSTLGKLHSEKTKENISETKKGTYSGEANHFYGKTHTDEAGQKMSEAKLGRKLSEELKGKISTTMLGRKLTEDHKANLSAAQPNSKKLSVLDIQTGMDTIYDSVAGAERLMNLPKDSIRANLRSKNKKPYRDRYIFNIID